MLCFPAKSIQYASNIPSPQLLEYAYVHSKPAYSEDVIFLLAISYYSAFSVILHSNLINELL